MTAPTGPRPPRIVIAAGGTAGHVVPAIAIADALRAEGAEVVFVGGERAEAELVPAAGYPFDADPRRGDLALEPAEGGPRRRRARPRRCGAAGRLLERAQADAVLGGGGYVAGPVGLAAVRRHIPLVLAEADSHLGLTNRLLARRARRVCLAFPIEGRDGDRYRVTGRPVPARIDDRAAARAELGIAPDATCVLVFGGSLGARSINQAAITGLAGAPYTVLHVVRPARPRRARLPRAGARRALRAARLRHAVRPRAGRRRPRGRALGRLGLRAGPVRAAGGAHPLPARVRRPPDRQRPLDGATPGRRW